MKHNLEPKQTYPKLVIHCTDDSFGFGYRKNNSLESDKFFIKRFEHDLCNNLIFDFNQFISRENLQKVKKISVSIGPANFNASRLIVVLARTISQQINCPLNSFSSFEIMAKRIALENKILKKNGSFWIYKKLKRKGFIAGKYKIFQSEQNNENLVVRETVLPKIINELDLKELFLEANFEFKEDLTELLNLSDENFFNSDENSWQKVFPLYPISPIN